MFLPEQAVGILQKLYVFTLTTIPYLFSYVEVFLQARYSYSLACVKATTRQAPHTLIVLSSLALKSCCPSLLIARLETGRVCPVRVRTSRPLDRSHTLIV